MSQYADLSTALSVLNNPQATGAELQGVAAEQPTLWQHIAAHPNAYPELLAWLGSVGDDSVRQAISRRQAAPVAPQAAPVVPEGIGSPPAVAPRVAPLVATPAAPQMNPTMQLPVMQQGPAFDGAQAGPAVQAPTMQLPVMQQGPGFAPAGAPQPGFAPTGAPQPGFAPTYGAPQMQMAPGYQVQPARKKPPVWLIILLAVVVLLAAVGAWYGASNWSIKTMTVRFGSSAGQNLTMNVGDTITGTVTTSPAKPLSDSFSFTSSARDVVKLSQGSSAVTLTALSPGTATITGVTKNRGVKTTTYVTVLQPATDIDVPTSLDLRVGDTVPIEATVIPADSTDQVTYSIDDESVASVDLEGTVTANDVGTATATVTAGTVTKTIDITVREDITWTKAPSTRIPGTTYEVPPWKFSTTVTGCTGFTLLYSISDVSPTRYEYLLTNTDFGVWVDAVDGGWQKVATFQYGDLGSMFLEDITFDPIDITAAAVVPNHTVNASYQWHTSSDILDLQQE